MADELTSEPAAEGSEKKSGLGGFILALLAVTIAGGVGGTLVSAWQVDTISTIARERANAEPEKTANALAWDESTAVARLEPVISNLAEPSSVFIRLDTAMVFDREAVDDVERMKAEISESVLAFLRTLSLGELQGASAFNFLRDDLNERARLTSSGTVSELLIETMVIQ